MEFSKFMSENALGYELLILKIREKKTWKEISTIYGQCMNGVISKYNLFLYNLFSLYSSHLSNIVPGFDENEIMEFYKSTLDAVAYLEKEYDTYLNAFRHGIHPVIIRIYSDFPSYRLLTINDICRLERKILTDKNILKKSFLAISKSLHLTVQKTRFIYYSYYHKKVKAAIDIIQPTVDFNFALYIYGKPGSYKRWWGRIQREYSELVRGL